MQDIYQTILSQNQSKLNKNCIDSLLLHLPEPIYWMDKNCVLLGSNDLEAQLFGFSSANELVGLTILDIAKKYPWNPGVAETLFKNSKEVMNTGIGKRIEEIDVAPNGESRTFISHKAPLYNKKNQIIGLIGTSINISEYKNKKEQKPSKNESGSYMRATNINENSFKNILSKNPKKYYLKGKYKGIYLTKRDIECLFYLVRGNSAKQIGKILNLSYRSIESYFAIIKEKLGCANRFELINVIVENQILNEIISVN